MNRLFRILLLLAFTPIVLAGCSQLKSAHLFGKAASSSDKLKVGITPDTPPLAYKKEDSVSGLETKFADGLARSMGKTLELVELPSQGLIPALVGKKIDIIMSGMTASETQTYKLKATGSYLSTGQVPLVRLDLYKLLGNTPGNLAAPNVRIGIVTDSLGDNFVNELKPKGKTTRFASTQEGVQALIDNTIDVFIADQPTVCYYAALYVDKGLTPGATFLTREELVWVVRPNDQEMLKAANEYLASIQKSGELNNLLEQSIPFFRNTAYSPTK